MDFLLPGHAATTNFENDAISDELCDAALDNLTEWNGTCDYIALYDFPQLPYICNSLSILHFNIRPLLANFDNLENFLSSIPLQPDIIGLFESCFKDKPLINIDLPGYRFVHVDSFSNADGVAAYVPIS